VVSTESLNHRARNDMKGNHMNFLSKYSTLILISLLVMMLALAWAFPSAGLKIGIIFLLASFLLAAMTVLHRHQKAYRKGEIGRKIFIRNAAIEISGVFLVMMLAGLLGRTAAEAATQGIGPQLLHLLAGIGIGLLVGLGVGMLGKETLRRFVQIPPQG
jgi:uncharacterized membrane protein YbjE (DUF340 family)